MILREKAGTIERLGYPRCKLKKRVAPNVREIAAPPLVIDEGEVETVLGVLADCLKIVFP